MAYIDTSVFNTPAATTTQKFNPIDMIKGTLGSTNPYNMVWDVINYRDKKEQQDYARALQKHLEEREDTAYQRTAKDMYAAGLNPLSMTGTDNAGAAVAQPDTTSGTPFESVSTSIQRFIDNANNTALAMDTIKNSETDRRLNTLRTIQEVAKIRSDIRNTDIDSETKKSMLDHLNREYKYMEKNNLYDYDNGFTQQLKAAVTFLTTDLPAIKNDLIKKYPTLKIIDDFLTTGKLDKDAEEKLRKDSPFLYFLIRPFIKSENPNPLNPALPEDVEQAQSQTQDYVNNNMQFNMMH